jgi:hypothetical protein
MTMTFFLGDAQIPTTTAGLFIKLTYYRLPFTLPDTKQSADGALRLTPDPDRFLPASTIGVPPYRLR